MERREFHDLFGYTVKKVDGGEKIGSPYVLLSVSEVITKRDYNAQVGMRTEFSFKKGGKALTLYSLGDTLQILSILQNDREKGYYRPELVEKII